MSISVINWKPRRFSIPNSTLSSEDSPHLAYLLTTLFLKMTRTFDNSVSGKWPDPLTTLFLKNDPNLWQLCSWKWPHPLTTLFLKMTRSFDNSVPENDPILWQSCSLGGLHRWDQGHLLGPRRGEHLHWAAGGAVQGPWVQRRLLDRSDHRLNMEFDLQRYLGSKWTAVLIGWDPASPPPPIWSNIRGCYWSAKIDDKSF